MKSDSINLRFSFRHSIFMCLRQTKRLLDIKRYKKWRNSRRVLSLLRVARHYRTNHVLFVTYFFQVTSLLFIIIFIYFCTKQTIMIAKRSRDFQIMCIFLECGNCCHQPKYIKLAYRLIIRTQLGMYILVYIFFKWLHILYNSVIVFPN